MPNFFKIIFTFSLSLSLLLPINISATTQPILLPDQNSCKFLDVDGDGKVQALVDGVLIARLLNPGIQESNILNGLVLSSSSIRTNVTEMKAFIQVNLSKYDVDGDGQSFSSTDAIFLTRYMLGIRGQDLVSGVNLGANVTPELVLQKITENCNASSAQSINIPAPESIFRLSGNALYYRCSNSVGFHLKAYPRGTNPTMSVLEKKYTYYFLDELRERSGETVNPNNRRFDVNNSGGITSADINFVRANQAEHKDQVYSERFFQEARENIGKPVDANNARYDVNNSGGINATDIALIRSAMINQLLSNNGSLRAFEGTLTVQSDYVSYELECMGANGTSELRSIFPSAPTSTQVDDPCATLHAPVCAQPKMPTCPPGMACPQVMPQPKTYSNKCEMNQAGATYLYDGVCNTGQIAPTSTPKVCTTEYSPVCAQPKMPTCPPGMACPQVMPQPKTYSNKCEMNQAGATYLYDGVCNTGQIAPTSTPKVCTTEYSPVCAQPKMPTCPPGMACPQVMPQPKTYSNKCEMNQAGATYLYDGVCNNFTKPIKTDLLDDSDSEESNSCVDLKYNMRIRSRDSNTEGGVSDLQFFLVSNNYMTIEPTGYFGPVTENAVRRFQADNNIVASGIVGQYTRAKIKEISCDPNYKPVYKTISLSEDRLIDVRNVAANVPDSQIFKPLPTATTASLEAINKVLAKVEALANQNDLRVKSMSNDLNSLTLILKASEKNNPGDKYFVFAKYKDTEKICVLTKDFEISPLREYSLKRDIKSSCINGGELGDLNLIEKIYINKR